MDSTGHDYSCDSINGSTRISRPDMTEIALEDSIFAQNGFWN